MPDKLINSNQFRQWLPGTNPQMRLLAQMHSDVNEALLIVEDDLEVVFGDALKAPKSVQPIYTAIYVTRMIQGSWIQAYCFEDQIIFHCFIANNLDSAKGITFASIA